MKKEWIQIKKWLQSNAPEVYRDLLPGLSKIEIDRAEKELEIEFPKEYKESLKQCNGQLGMKDNLIGDWRLLRLEATIKEWKALNRLFPDDNKNSKDNWEKYDWWNKKWIPIAYNGAGDFLCIDLSQSETEIDGQIITYWHTKEERSMIYKSFKNFIEAFLKKMLAGEYLYGDK
ncbi:SMI1/KNR4 family protein [Aquimarina sp. 2201CG5-10]|uniref:SMI1/KNR4 family protein n=1 Tax=Aquimarina callyspongiae TaxID=3098150 RepID=UPI002AB43ADB|nr:SMI1/KNR4 family protein [Aquimarina sp. 2201CG5-10]MDY8138082.1 SMI1/KNR4 family protein [Aquimarina sp. 2201CG5-10]